MATLDEIYRSLGGRYGKQYEDGVEITVPIDAVWRQANDLFRRQQVQSSLPEEVAQYLDAGVVPVNYGVGSDVLRDGQGRVLGKYITGEQKYELDGTLGPDERQVNYVPWEILQKYPQLKGELATQYQSGENWLDRIMPSLAIAMATAGFMNGVPAFGAEAAAAAPYGEMAAAESALAAESAAMGGASAGGTAASGGLQFDPSTHISGFDAGPAFQPGTEPSWVKDLLKGNTFLPGAPGVGQPPLQAPGAPGGNSGGSPTGGEKAPAPKPTDKKSMSDTLKTAASGASLATQGMALLSGDSAAGGDLGGDMLETEEQRQARILASTGAINDVFAGFDDKYFSGIADAYRNFAMPQFTEQVREARRRLPMTVPHTQSSAYQRKASDMEADILRNEANIGREAINEANKRRGELDFERSQLLSLAQGAAPTETIAQQAALRAQSLAEPPSFSPLADMLGKYLNDTASVIGVSRAQQPTAQVVRPLTFSHSPGKSMRYVA